VLSCICTRAGSLACLSILLAIPSWSQQSVADKMIAQRHYNRALPLVRAALKSHPRDISALVALSTIQWAFGQLDASIATAGQAVQTANESAAAHAQLLNALGAKLASSRTGTLEKVGLTHRFREEADRTLQLDPRNIYAHEALARFYWYAPAMVGGSRDKAKQWVDKLLLLDAARAYELKAELDATAPDKARRSSAVQNDWMQAVAANQKRYEAYAGLGRCILSGGNDKLGEAEDAAKKALFLDQSRIDSYRLLAAVYVRTARWDQLDVTLRNAHAAVPDDLTADFVVAQTILERNIGSQWGRAEDHLRVYLGQPNEGLEPTLAMAHWKLGIVLEREGRKNAALKELEIAVQVDSSLAEAKNDLRRLQ
jgi:tetratricopeptide (TPR) repeat protein